MQAIACRLLPGAHWALLYVIAVAFVLSFIMFESGGSFSNEGRHTLWTMLCALMVFVLTVRVQGFPARPAVNAAQCAHIQAWNRPNVNFIAKSRNNIFYLKIFAGNKPSCICDKNINDRISYSLTFRPGFVQRHTDAQQATVVFL